MKKKQIIRLTESDLHKVIKESVKKVLNELAPETYYNAANKRARQGNQKSGNKLFNYSLDRVVKDNNVKNADAFNFGRKFNNSSDRYEVTYSESPWFDTNDKEQSNNWDNAARQAEDLHRKKWNGKEWI